MRKRYIVVLAAMAAALVAVFAAAPVSANPPGIIDVGKKIANFNIILHPHAWDNLGNACNGSRIFFATDATPWTITWNFDPTVNNFSIVDCNATTDGSAVIAQNAGTNVAIFVRVVGPKNSSLGLVCTDVLDVNTVNSCLLGTYNLSKGKTFTKVTTHLFDTVFSQVLWTLQPSTNFKIAQVDVYQLNT
jgi:hypothetical protein